MTAFQILDEMKTKGFIITTETLNFLLQACISLPRDGFKYAIMVRMNTRPRILNYIDLRTRCGANFV